MPKVHFIRKKARQRKGELAVKRKYSPTIATGVTLKAPQDKINQKESTYLKLPAEIRNMIYHYICQDEVIILEVYGTKVKRSFPDKSASSILHTCRQIRHEVLPIYFQHAVFQLQPRLLDDCMVPIARIDKNTRKAIKKIRICSKQRLHWPAQLDQDQFGHDRVCGVAVPSLELIQTEVFSFFSPFIFTYRKVDGIWTRDTSCT